MTAHYTQPHHVVTDEEYFEALPPAGLALAREQLEDNLARAIEDEAFPAKDAIVGLAIINALEQSQDDQASA